MTDCNARDTASKQLRAKLVGKPLVGFDTKYWDTLGTDGSVKGRTGGKAGSKTAPAKV